MRAVRERDIPERGFFVERRLTDQSVALIVKRWVRHKLIRATLPKWTPIHPCSLIDQPLRRAECSASHFVSRCSISASGRALRRDISASTSFGLGEGGAAWFSAQAIEASGYDSHATVKRNTGRHSEPRAMPTCAVTAASRVAASKVPHSLEPAPDAQPAHQQTPAPSQTSSGGSYRPHAPRRNRPSGLGRGKGGSGTARGLPRVRNFP
jgi:hypothetical protein